MINVHKGLPFGFFCVFVAQYSGLASALELYSTDAANLKADIDGGIGVYHSQQNYAQSGTLKKGGTDWQEAYLKYGLSGWLLAGDHKEQAYGALNWVSSATFGQGDAAGWTNGTERTTKIEDAYLGWKSGESFPGLGDNGIDVSFGRQNIVIGDGFLIGGDALNIGKGVLDGGLNRGGAYYITPRKAFDQTAVLKIGGTEGLRGDLMWLKSDNPAQAKAESIVGTLEHVSEKGTVGFTYMDIVDTDDEFDFIKRDGTKTYSVRAQGNAGHPNLFLSGEYAWQDRPEGDESAWYLEAGWKFSETYGSPSVNYRYSRYSEGYDALFFGNIRALGTWFQGEVASNYAGPFNTNTRVHQVALSFTPVESLSFGVLLYNFDTLSKSAGAFSNLDGNEVDLYATWQANEHLSVVPVLGIYKPDASDVDGGSQIGTDRRNIYSQILFLTKF
ncbi:hypothetical protein [Pseudomonas sp. GL-RE-19]|uniref:hypothetical protein n=1 Tax=Pseudomonas sp. GL-RE-19 TaxID=2832389 RepID=UPI001CBF823B|nr:hypothetical protein [Pseudomonas sp. GL-RE-19]